MARTSTEAAQMFQRAYDKSKDIADVVKRESRAVYGDVRQWLPEHPTAVAVSVSAVVCAGAVGYTLGRRRHRRTGIVSAAIARAPELNVAPFFKFLKLWLLYRVATKI
jgi:hypothetical protein